MNAEKIIYSDKDSEEDKSETAATKTDGAETPVVPSLDATKNPIPAKTNENTAEAGTKSENEAALEAQLQQTATDKAQLEQINQALQTQNSNLNASLCNLQGKGSLDDTFGLAAKSTENEANLTKISEAILKGRVEGAAKKVCAAPDRALAIEEELAQLDIPQDGELMSKSQARTLKSYIASLRAQSNNASVDPIDQRRMEMALAETAKTEALRKLAKQHTNLATLQRDLNQYSTEQLMGNGLETAFMYFSPNYVQVAADFASYYKVEEQKYRATHDFTKEVTEGAICASQLGVAAASRLLDATQQEENFMEPFRKASLRNALGAAMGSGSVSGHVRKCTWSKTSTLPQGI